MPASRATTGGPSAASGATTARAVIRSACFHEASAARRGANQEGHLVEEERVTDVDAHGVVDPDNVLAALPARRHAPVLECRLICRPNSQIYQTRPASWRQSRASCGNFTSTKPSDFVRKSVPVLNQSGFSFRYVVNSFAGTIDNRIELLQRRIIFQADVSQQYLRELFDLRRGQGTSSACMQLPYRNRAVVPERPAGLSSFC